MIAPLTPPAPPTYTSELHILAEAGEWDILSSRLKQYLLTKDEQDVKATDDHDDPHISASKPEDVSSSSSSSSASTDSLLDHNNNKSILQQLKSGEGPHSWTPLMLSCNRAPPHVIELMLKCCPESANICDRTGTYPLHFVLWWNDDDGDDGSNDSSSADYHEPNDDGDSKEEEVEESQNQKLPKAKGDGRQQSATTLTSKHSQYHSQHVNERTLHKVLWMLVRANPKVLSYQNQWGMTPLHSLFDRETLTSVETLKILLGLKSKIKDGSRNSGSGSDASSGDNGDNSKNNKDEEEEDENIHSYALLALTKPDSNFQLPLHLAASRGANEEILRLLVSLYPESATITTGEGDLPIHLLQYWAEDEAKNFSMHGDSTHNITVNNFWFDSGVFRVSKRNMYSCITVGQVEALLEPMCISSNSPPSPKMNVDEVNSIRREERKKDPQSKIFKSFEQQIDMEEFKQNTINLASRQPGSRDLLPIHIAADHGVSFKILSALCEKYPEGVATPRLCHGGGGSKRSLLSSADDDSSSKRWPQEMYPIEIFETGRAGLSAEIASQIQQKHESSNTDGGESRANANDTIASDSKNLEHAIAELDNFEDRSDLLFAYYPDAVPWKYREQKEELRRLHSKQLSRKSDLRNANQLLNKASAVLYRNDIKRIMRLERRIRSEALKEDIRDFGMTSKLIWRWIYESVHSSEGMLRGNHQGSIGRIITNLPDKALLKLSYHIHSFKADGSVSEDSNGSLRNKPCLIQGASILDMAKNRGATISMHEMLSFTTNGKYKYNWQSVVCEFLTAEEGLQYNALWKKNNGAGLRYLAESKLPETGRTWNFPSDDDQSTQSEVSEFWQHLNSSIMIPEITHTVLVKYYLEVSGESLNSTLGGAPKPLPLDQIKGGLTVVCEKNLSNENNISSEESIKDNSLGEHTVGCEQKKLLGSKLKSLSGYEVCLSFRFKVGHTYSLRARAPADGGRVSVSNARIQQVIHSVDRYNRTPLHVLLSSKMLRSHVPISTQVKMILKGRSEASDSVPLHLALKFGASIEVLNALIAINPSSLLKKDDQGCTPLHYMFLISEEIRPSLGVVRCLLTTPGENATRLKDSADRLPLHIAAERAADAEILELLIEANADGCYRKNRDGDLPIHLLVRSGKATPSTVEMLLLPIIDSETICGVPGSRGLELPLHIAAEYNCTFKVLERLLLSYSKAAAIPRMRSSVRGQPASQMYALDIFEEHRNALVAQHIAKRSRRRSMRSLHSSHSGVSQSSIFSVATEDAARIDMELADFDLRSDLLFVFFPKIPSTDGSDNVYRKDINRIKRLQHIIRKEAISCAEYLSVNDEAIMSDMAQLAWCFFCTFENPGDTNDEYSSIVGQILSGLSNPVVQILSKIRNPYSYPNPHMPILECATAKCKRLISSRLLFVGRFTLAANNKILHKSEGCILLKATDHYMEESFRRFMSTFKKEDDVKDIDDLASCHSNGNIVPMLSFGDDAQSLFVDFACKLGFDEDEANEKYEKLVINNDADESFDIPDLQAKIERKEMTLGMFRKFCDTHRIDNSGARRVVIKFMKDRSLFLREKAVRKSLSLPKEDCCIFQIIEDYDIDRVQDSSRSLSTSVDSRSIPGSIALGHRLYSFDDKDSIYAMDVIENSVLGYDLSAFKYSLVLPSGDRNLEDILQHESLDSVNTRDILHNVGEAIKKLHDRNIVHGNINASNIVRIGSHFGLVDFDSASFVEGDESNSCLSNHLAGVSQKSSSGILPPELLFRVDVKNNDVLQRFDKYWNEVQSDSLDFDLLSADDIHTISSIVKSFLDEDNALKRAHGVLGALANKLNISSDDDLTEISWREKLSENLQGINFIDLPNALAECHTIHEFHDVWNRMRAHSAFWKKIRPRVDNDQKYAYFVKYYDDSVTRTQNEHDDLPYELVQANYSADIWAFGVLMFLMCSRTSLFHTTIDGELLHSSSYQELHDWNSETAQNRISSSIKDPIAQDLLKKILAPEEERISSLEEVLQHPYFGPSSSMEAQKIVEDHEEKQLEKMDSDPRLQTKTHDIEKVRLLSMEKYCKIVYDRLEDIPYPTNLIVLPYKLVWNNVRNTPEIPRDTKTLTLGALIGSQLIRFNTIIAKLSFWLRVKDNLCQKGRGEFRAKVLSWIQRARTEGSYVIASEIITAVGCDVRYLGICVEMLDEEMSITNARAFIRDPMKAAAMLTETIFHSLLTYYNEHHLYLVDEFHGSPTISIDEAGRIQNTTYPISFDKSGNDFKDFLFPFMVTSMMTATSFDGLQGLIKLLGFPPSYPIPKAWIDANVGVIPLQNPTKSLPPNVVPFATLHNILRQNSRNLEFRQTGKYSIRTTEGLFPNMNISDAQDELTKLQAFFQKHDPSSTFANLTRIDNEQDPSLVSWTHETRLKAQYKQQHEEFNQALQRLKEVQKEIQEKKRLEDEVLILTHRIMEMKQRADARSLRKSQKAAAAGLHIMQHQLHPQQLVSSQTMGNGQSMTMTQQQEFMSSYPSNYYQPNQPTNIQMPLKVNNSVSSGVGDGDGNLFKKNKSVFFI